MKKLLLILFLPVVGSFAQGVEDVRINANGTVINVVPSTGLPKTVKFATGQLIVNGVAVVGGGASGVTSVTGTAPIVSSGGTTPAISITAATTGAAGSMSAADKTKLDGIAAGAQPGTVTSVAVSVANGIGVTGSPITTAGTFALSLGAITPTSVAASGAVSGSNLSGTNTGDQTSIVGITGTLAQFNTALTGADFATGGGTATGTNTGDQDLSGLITNSSTTGAVPITTDLSGNLGPSSITEGIGTTLIGNLTSNGFVKTTGGTGALSIDTAAYLTTDTKWDGGAAGLVAATGRTSLGLGTLATQSGTFSGTSSGTNTGDQDLSALALKATTISTTSPLTGGGDLSANRTFAINNAAADGSTKGAASFAAADFDATSGNIGIDYTNGQAATTSLKGFLTSADWTTFNNKGSGTVTSFSAGDLAPLFTTSEATITTTPALTFSLSTAAANTFFGNGTGSTAAPTFMSASTARTALTLVPGTDVQAFDADLLTIAGLTATTDNFLVSVASAWTSRTPAQVRTTLGLVIGTNVQAWDTDLDTWATKTPFAGTLTITTGKTFNVTNTLTLSGTDSSTLNIGTGGTLGTNAYTSTAFAPIASPTFTGTPLSTTAAVDVNTTQIATTAFVLAQAASATPIQEGVGTVGSSTRYARADHVHPQAVEIGVAISDETTDITTGTAKVTFRVPYAFTVTAVRANVNTVSSSGIPTVDINEGGTTILSTKLTIDASEKSSTTAAAAAVISDSSIADDAEITMDIDVAGTGAKGLKVWMIGRR